MPRYSCALTLSGVVDVEDVDLLGSSLDAVGANFGNTSCADCLLDDESEFFFDDGFSADGPFTLQSSLATPLSKLHLSWCFMVLLDGVEGRSMCQIVDRALGLEATFPCLHGIFDASGYAPNDPRAALAPRWQGIDEAPKFHLLRSSHDALALAQNPSGHEADLAAYWARREARA